MMYPQRLKSSGHRISATDIDKMEPGLPYFEPIRVAKRVALIPNAKPHLLILTSTFQPSRASPNKGGPMFTTPAIIFEIGLVSEQIRVLLYRDS
jgi:hypothetical protein